VPIVGISALNGRGIDRLMPRCSRPTTLEQARADAQAEPLAARDGDAASAAAAHGRRIRLRFMTQIKIRPPTFILSVSQPEELGDDYLRFLINRLRDDFEMPGVPIRLTMRKPNNPYASRAKRR
jgi:GTP-binding protein